MQKKRNMARKKRVRQILKEHWLFVVLAIVIYFIGVLSVIYKPKLGSSAMIKDTFWLLALSIQSFVILVAIGISLVKRWFHIKKKQRIPLVWGVSFLLFSITFLGLILESLGFSCGSNNIICFFVFRQFMIWFAVGIFYGLADTFIRRKPILRVISLLALIAGYQMFFFGLVKANNIEFTMYLFLFFIFIPVCILMSYLFWDRAKKKKVVSFKYISVGFLGVGLIYSTWAPWHGTNIYPLCFAIFNLTLIPLLYGFWTLKLEKVVSISP